jgi:signal peptidase II
MFYVVSAIVLFLDQLTKFLALKYLAGKPPTIILSNYLWLRYAENKGGAFSMFSNHSGVLTIVSLAAVIIIFAWHFSLHKQERLQRVSLALIFGGALGNLLDRFIRGYVIDFIDAHWRNSYHWPTFNVADSSICIGIALFILAMLIQYRAEKRDVGTKSKIEEEPQSQGNTT